MIEIKIRGRTFHIHADEHSWAVHRAVPFDGKPTKKQEKNLCHGHRHTDSAWLLNIEQVCRHLFDYNLRKSDVTSLNELVREAKALRRDIRELLEDAA